jgi:hypothetical protein
VIVVILMAIGIHSCQVSARNSSLKDYNTNVYSLIQQSNGLGRQLFTELSSASGSSNVTNVQAQIGQTLQAARRQLGKAQGWSVPSEMDPAQANLLLALRMRRDGMSTVASQIQPALGKSTSHDAVNQIAAAMAHFYASDVVYKSYTVPQIVAALHAAGIPVGGANGQAIQGGQFLNDLGWLQPSFVAGKLGAQVSTGKNGKPAPGLHGHSLNSVSVGSTTLSTSATNTLSAHPAPTFSLNITNGGQFPETATCKVSINGASDSGTATVQTTAGQTTNCQVTLPSAPSPGTYTVTATVEPVPGEHNTANNTLSFTIVFQ